MPKVFTLETRGRREEGEPVEGEGRRECIDTIKQAGKEL